MLQMFVAKSNTGFTTKGLAAVGQSTDVRQ